MRKVLFIIMTLIMSVSLSSGSCSDVNSINHDAKIEQFSLLCGQTSYIGKIDQESKTISIGGITSSKSVSGVKYSITGGATISPLPEEIKVWKQEQIFIVSSSDKKTISEYTLLLPDIESSNKVVIGYLPANDGQFESQFNKIHWNYLTHVNISFALVKSDGSLNTIRIPQAKMDRILKAARANGVKVLISIAKNSVGEFKAAISDETSRTKLVGEIIKFTKDNNLDGFDIDYEEYDGWDITFPHLLEFVKQLHKQKEQSMLMTCAVVGRWLDYTTQWHQYFDYINLMCYDRGCYTENPIQHSKYEDFVIDLNNWLNVRQAPKSKIVGGLPFYGYSWDADVNKDSSRGIRFYGVLEHFGKNAKVADTDQMSKTYYNGRKTIAKKCKYVIDNDFGGVMIWQLFQDAHEEDLKLINVVHKEMSGSQADESDNSNESKRAVVAYLPPNDAGFENGLEKLNWKYITHVNICFALAAADGSLNTERLPKAKMDRIVKVARDNGVKVLISIAKNAGGEFAEALSTEQKRERLVKEIIRFTKDYELDGFDIDYEDYNSVDWKTSFPNVLAFVKALHKAKGENMLMTCAVTGRRIDYTSEWHQYFDLINLMCYGRGAFTDTPVQHAKYDDFVGDLNIWVTRWNVPKSKIVGGLPFYGFSWDAGVPKDDKRRLRYSDIINHFGAKEAVADTDQINQTYFNGSTTIAKKCRYVIDNGFGGVMIWQIFQDTNVEQFKLLNVIGREMAK